MYITVPVSWGIRSERPKQREVQRQTLAVSEDGKREVERAQALTLRREVRTVKKTFQAKYVAPAPLPRLTRSHPGAGKERGKGGPVGRKRRRRFSPGFHFCTLHLSSSSSPPAATAERKKFLRKKEKKFACAERGRRERNEIKSSRKSKVN